MASGQKISYNPRFVYCSGAGLAALGVHSQLVLAMTCGSEGGLGSSGRLSKGRVCLWITVPHVYFVEAHYKDVMKKKELDQFKKILLEEKKKILGHLQTLSDTVEEEEIVPSGDSADIASLEINHANLQKIGKRETYLLKKIDLALAKIDDGTYGECENCGEQIAVARLQARPVAQLCIDCKTEQENTERKFTTRDVEEESGEESGSEESEEAD